MKTKGNTMKVNENISKIALKATCVMAFAISLSFINPVLCHGIEKKTIVVNRFDTSGYVYGVERVVPDMIISELVGTGLFTVLEKDKFDDIKREQADCLTGVYDKKKCPQVGKAFGADLQLNGVVSQVGIEQKDLNVGSFLKNSDYANIRRRVVTARVKIDVRIVDGTTRGIVLAASGMGAETDEDWNGTGNFDNILSHIEVGNSEWEQSFIGKAVRRAVQDIVRQIVMQLGAGGFSGREGLVTAVSGNYVYFNIGAAQGLEKGMKMTISKRKDVFNGRGTLVYRGKEAVAVIVITDVQESAAQGKIVERIEPVGEGYLIEIKE
jgi:curli biogenesis system outer membrane secretion channel CsgG